MRSAVRLEISWTLSQPLQPQQEVCSAYHLCDGRLIDPLLFDRLIRRFQSEAERDAERRGKGLSGILQADLNRAEVKIKKIDESQHSGSKQAADGHTAQERTTPSDEVADVVTKEEGVERWRELMTEKFVAGKDCDFDYEKVDLDEKLDDTKFTKGLEEDSWFDQEEPSQGSKEADSNKLLEGQTGVQDF